VGGQFVRVGGFLPTYFVSKNMLCLLSQYQSAYQPFHSTETAVPHVLLEILTAVDRGDVAALILLNLSAASDTVDHILLRHLQYS
jgi:hypothetical protein